ncbi:MAG: hypothetical protein IIC72_00855 [Acidobacteria bacterium]|nr:hypothetical protein [Acidobacteriota bacterium]TDI52759.1 MAG: hypothetical protein E2O97_01705 [Acidobacteriota bacterium]TDI55120.1 MAG: hypothetical protein E2O96_06190 [Acidobacteriota bacterium]
MINPADNPSAEEVSRWHRTFAPRAFNHTWTLLDETELTREQEEEMLASTFAQRHHWYNVGEPKNWAVADWQVSRVAAVLGYADLSRRFGERSLELAKEHDLGPFLTGFAHEAIARAAADVDDVETFTEHLEMAKAALPDIEDAEEREVLAADLTEMSEG